MWRRVDVVWTDVSEERIRERETNARRWLAPAHSGFSLADFPTLKMEAIRSSETSVHTRSTRSYIQEDGILQ
jgi:hypothetical protein